MMGIEMAIPRTINELVTCLQKKCYFPKILAGGTDLVVSMNEGNIKPDYLIDLSGIDELRIIERSGDTLLIGACSVYSQMAENDLIINNFKSLVQASEGIGSKQIRNRGTIGGNIANSSPAGDMIPPLVSLNASVITINSAGIRCEKLIDDLIIGVGKNKLAPDEVIIFIKIPIPREERLTRFFKIGNRRTVTIARLSVAINFEITDHIVEDAVIILGAVGQTVIRAKELEEVLKGLKISSISMDLLAESLARAIEVSIPGRASLNYKKEAIRGIADDIIASIADKL